MPRRRVTRPECDCSDCRYVFPSDSLLGTSVSRQQPPPKCLIVCAPACLKTDGGSTSEASTELQYPHIVAAVRSGSSGLLALRTDGEPVETSTQLVLSNLLSDFGVQTQPEAKGEVDRRCSLLLRLLSLSQTTICVDKPEDMGSEFVADSEKLKRWAQEHGFEQTHDVCSHDIDSAAKLIAQRLGLEKQSRGQQSSRIAARDPAELLFVGLGAAQTSIVQSQSSSGRDRGNEAFSSPAGSSHDSSNRQIWVAHPEQLARIDELLRLLNDYPQFRETVLLVVLLGLYDPAGSAIPVGGSGNLQASAQFSGYEDVVRPLQSFEFAGLDRVPVDRCQSLICIQRLPYVIRRDKLERFPRDLDDFCPGNGCILAERLLPELAYKMGHAPKYGA